jgi:amino acid adenylation domain-containing protein
MRQQNGKINEKPGLSEKRQAVLDRLLKVKVPLDFKLKSIPKREVFSPVPLSFSQERLWVLDRLVPGSSIYNFPSVVRIKGELDLPVFERSINESIRRHESLRTIFKMENEEPVQVIMPQMQTKIEVIELSHLPAPEREKETNRLTAEEAGKPFDLERGPLLRVLLLVHAIDTHILLYTMHHIITDGWSLELFRKELITIYEAYLAGNPSPLPEPSVQYADFALWQREQLQGEALQKQLSYWKNVLSGDIPILELPADRQRPAISSYRGEKQKIEIPESLTVRLVELTRKQGCSMFMIMLAAFNVLLYRYSGQDDILIGTPIANRTKPELEEIIGFFANTLVIRTDLTGSPTFNQLLRRVRRITAGAYDNQDLPFEKLVEELQPDRYMSHNPLFQAMLVLQNVPKQTTGIDNIDNKKIRINYLSSFSGSVRFDLWLSLSQYDKIISGVIEYSTDIFADDTITRLCVHFKNLLEAIAADPGQPIDDIRYLSDEEKEQLLTRWNDTGKAYDIQPLHHMFEAQVEKTPDNIALHVSGALRADLDAFGGLTAPGDSAALPVREVRPVQPVRYVRPVSLTYRELEENSNRLACCLKEKGAEPDTIVGIKIERSVEMVVGLMGILKAGAAYMPIDPDYPQERIDYMLKDSGAKILLTGQEIAGLYSPQALYLSEGHHPIFLSSHLPNFPASLPSSLAYIIYTSGSTGKPKGVMITHKGISNRLQWMQDAYGLTTGDRVLQKTSYSFDVSVWEFFWTLSYGAVLIMAKPGGHKDAAYLVKTINREKITTIHFVPTMLNVFLDEPGIGTIRSLKRVICSGEALPVEYQEKFFTLFDPAVGLHNLYGPTEASVDVTHWACERNSPRHLVPIGKPIANTRIYILDRNLNLVPIGIQGEFYIGGIQLARGYINRPELTAEKFIMPSATRGSFEKPPLDPAKLLFIHHSPLTTHHSPIYRTGDLARWLPDGTIEFLGRLDFQVKVRGFRIELGEIETNLRENEDVSDAVVLVMDDSPGEKGKKLVAYVVPGARYWKAYAQEETFTQNLSGEQITDWQDVFNDAYTKDTLQGDPTFNTTGWNSSYTGVPIPAGEMRLWVEQTVQRILSYQPRNVMEIGCGTGLFLFRIIPHCRRYLGTDIAQEGLNYIDSHLEKIKQTGWADIRTMCRSADNFDGIEPGELDMIILNSVIQYFPTVEYLEEVLEKAAQKIKPGGHIFIGDVRSLPLLKAFHASVELSKAEPDVPKETILRRVLNKIAREQELVIDPLFFDTLKKRNPRVKHVEPLIKYGRYNNELSKFRYDIILHIGAEDKELPLIQPDLILEWNKEKPGLGEIKDILSGRENQGSEPGCIIIASVPNARVQEDIRELKRLTGREEPGIARGIEPDDILELEKDYPYHISLQVSPLPGEEGAFDVVFIHRDMKAKVPGALVCDIHPTQPPGETSGRKSYTNDPLLVRTAGRLVPQLRDFLKERLPVYMVPTHFVLLERLPVTSNGKLDRRMLPEPVQVEQTKEFVEPTTETEIFLARLWKEILNLEQVGVNQNFFELGGDSVNAIQVVSRANKQGVEISVQLLFRNQTIAELASAVEKSRHRFIKVGENTYNEFMMSLEMEAILKQLPAGLEVEDIYPATPLQLHQVHFLETRGIEDPPVFLYQRRDLPMNITLDVEELEKVLQIVSQRHRMLRTLLIWKNLKEPVQVVCKKLKFDFSYHDLTSIPPAKKIPGVYELLKQDWKKTFVRNNSSPMRIGIFKLDENLFQYYITGDYMRMEGWSAIKFIQEIFSFYEILKSGADIPHLPPHANCYKEYVHTIRILRKQDENPARRYWRSVFKDFSGMESLTSIPGNRMGQGTGFGVSHFYLSPGKSARMEQFLLGHRLSLSPLIQGTWAALLGIYLRQDRVVYGMVTTGRSMPIAGIEHMIGHSINILPVPVHISKGKPLLDYFMDILDIQTEWTRHEYTQIDQIYEWLDLPGDRPLFDHYIVIQNLASALGEIRGMERDKNNWSRKAELMFAKMEYPLRFDIFPGYEYCFIFQYHLRFFTTPVLKGLMDNFKTLIETIIENPGQTFEEWTKSVDTEKYKLHANESPDGFVQQ